MRKVALNRMNELEKICRACPLPADLYRINYCISKCELRHEFRRVGKVLDRIAGRKSRKIMRKGEDMTTDEVFYLLERGYSKCEIGKAMGYSHATTFRRLSNISQRGIGTPDPVKKITILEQVHMLAERGLSIEEIQKELNHPIKTIQTYYYRWRSGNGNSN